jgi:hypothetical protein
MAREREPRIPPGPAPEQWSQLGGEMRGGRHVLPVRV